MLSSEDDCWNYLSEAVELYKILYWFAMTIIIIKYSVCMFCVY